MPDQERLDIISGAIAGLLRRQEAIEERLARIEQALDLILPTTAINYSKDNIKSINALCLSPTYKRVPSV